jgi:hypothetical protein
MIIMSRKTLLAVMLALIGTTAVFAQQVPQILYYKFNEGSGTQITNFAVPGNTQYFASWQGGGGGVWDTTTPQLGSGAMDFAALDRLRTGWDNNLSQSFTIECWIRVNNPSPTGCGLNACPLDRLWGNYATGYNFFRCYIGFYNEGANFLGGGLPALNSAVNPVAPTAIVTDGAWHHIALVYDVTTTTLTSYIDGILDQTAIGGPGAHVPGTSFYLGGTADDATGSVGAPFNGSVDEFRVWSTARTQTEILANMMNELTLPVQAAFSVNRTSGPAPLLVSFRDQSSTTDPGGIVSWSWDFGNGVNSSVQNPCYVYTTPGSYTPTLLVQSAGGLTDLITAATPIVVGAPDFVVASCGAGDLFMGAPPPPPTWTEGYTILSSDTNGSVGSGWFFGLYPDLLTWDSLRYPAIPGSPLHFVNVANPNLFPEAPLSLPPGTINLAGLTLDALLIYLDGNRNLLSATSVSRVTF